MAHMQSSDTDHATGTEIRRRAPWPVPADSLIVLADLGMTDEAIGRYFRVEPSAVRNARTAAQSNCSALIAANSR